MTSQEIKLPPLADRPSEGTEVLDRLRVLVVAGIVTGVVVVGIGGRLAMFLLRLTSPGWVRGLESDDGFIIGRFTLSGTYNLLMLGATVGVLGAATYRAVSPWLLGPKWFRLATIAAAAGAVVGSMLIHADGIDFNVLKPLWLAIGLFIALPALFGVAIAVAVDRLTAAAPPRAGRAWVLPIVLLVMFPLVLLIVLVAGLALVGWVPVRRLIESRGGATLPFGVVIRAGWLSIAVFGLVALIADVQSLV